MERGPASRSKPIDLLCNVSMLGFRLRHGKWINDRFCVRKCNRSVRRISQYLCATPIPPLLGDFERILKQNAKSGDFIFGKKIAYADLSPFQMIEGLRYAFPKTMARLEPQHPRLATLHDRVIDASPHRRLSILTEATRVRRAKHFPPLSRVGRGIDARGVILGPSTPFGAWLDPALKSGLGPDFSLF
jgi:hypothetical protein